MTYDKAHIRWKLKKQAIKNLFSDYSQKKV